MRKMFLLLVPLALYAVASLPAKRPTTADWGSCSFDCSPCLTTEDCTLTGSGTCLDECP